MSDTVSSWMSRLAPLRAAAIIFALPGLLIGLAGQASASNAIDCGKQMTPIEKAICQSEPLKKSDANLAVLYTTIYDALKSPTERAVFQAEEVNWLKMRRKTCEKAATDDLNTCLATSLSKRQTEMSRLWGQDPSDLDVGSAGQLVIGKTSLAVVHDGETAIVLKVPGRDKPLLQGEKSDYQEPAVSVLRRYDDPKGMAALIAIHNAGDINETNYSILVDSEGGALTKIDFGSSATTWGSHATVERAKLGFRYEQPALPSQPGKWMEWSFARGIKTGAIAYVPSGGSTMESLYQSDNIRDLEPLDNKAFYKAVMDLPVEDRKLLLVSMSGIANLTCDCSGVVDTGIYGTRKAPDLLAFSNCGLEFDGHILNCFGNDALAVWERKSGRFFFAINTVKYPDWHSRDDDSLHFYPASDIWPEAAKSQLDDWQTGAAWPDE